MPLPAVQEPRLPDARRSGHHDNCRRSGDRAVSASLLPCLGCMSGTGYDRALADARRSSAASVRRIGAAALASGRIEQRGAPPMPTQDRASVVDGEHFRFGRRFGAIPRDTGGSGRRGAAAVAVGVRFGRVGRAGSAFGSPGRAGWIRASGRVATCAAGQADAAQRRRWSSRRPQLARPRGPAASRDDDRLGTPAARFAGGCHPRAS